MKPHFINRLLLAGLLTLAVSAVRADEEQDLLATLKSNATVPQKCAACQRLRFVGTVQSVPALAALLDEDRTSHAARYALEGMPYPEAGAALRQALEKTTGLIKAGLVDSLGWRHDTAAVPSLVALLAGPDPILAGAAAAALGRIGGPDARAALTTARAQASPELQVTVLESLLQCAEQLQASGDAPGTAALYRSLDTRKSSASIRAAAWRGVVMSDTASRPALVAKAVSSPDRLLRTTALKVLREVNDAQVVSACLREWPSLAAEAQLAVLDAQLKLGTDSRATVQTAMQSQHQVVRVAALQALADLGDLTAIPMLAKAAATGATAERDTARDTLARLRGEGAREALLKNLDTAPPPEKAELLRVLGERGDTQATGVLLQNAATGPEPVRLAALESLRKLAVPETITPLLDLTAKSKSESDREPVLQALYAVCQASRDKEQTARRVLEAMNQFPTAERRQVLPLLAELATPAALEAAQAATRDPDAALVKEAVRVLGQWPSAAPAPRLLEMARVTTDPTLQVLALRGYIEVAGLEPDATKRLALLQQAAAAAQRPDEKKLALGQIGQIPTAEALQAVLASLSDPTLATEAGLAAVSIAEKLAAANPKLASDVAAQVLAQCKSPEIVKRAWTLRGKLKASGPFIWDWLAAGPYTQAGATGAMGVFDIPFAPEKPGQTVQWKPVPKADMIDLLAVFSNQASCAGYLKTTIIAPQDCDGALLMGSDDGLKAWLNGAVVHANNVDRGAVVDQDMAPIKLKKGPNSLLLKITQGGGGWAVCARIVDANGLPIAGLKAEAR